MESFKPLTSKEIQGVWDHVERTRLLTQRAAKVLGRDHGFDWMKTPCPDLAGDTPNSRASTSKGAEEVKAVLNRIADEI